MEGVADEEQPFWDELPLDPNLDELPPEVEQHSGPLYFAFADPKSGAVYPLRRVTREEIAAMLADERRRREAGDAGAT